MNEQTPGIPLRQGISQSSEMQTEKAKAIKSSRLPDLRQSMTINPLDFDEHSRNKISSFGENSAQVTTEKFRATQTIDAANQTLRSSSYPLKMGITETNFNALQDKVRNLGVGPNGQQLTGVTYNQDRLIASIGIVKEVLISNMQLREDLLNVTQEHDETI